MHGDEHPMRTTTHPESIPPSPARAILYSLSSKRDSPDVAVWDETSDSNSGASLGLFGQRFNLDGSASGSVFKINSFDTTANSNVSPNQLWPSVTEMQNGGFAVTWRNLAVESITDSGSDVVTFGGDFDNADTYTMEVNGHTLSITASNTDQYGVVAWSMKRLERALPETDFRRCVRIWGGQVQSSG
jgi:hypothetical protein